MLNEALRLIRAYHDISQSQLSSELRISNSYLSEIESGKKQPTLEFLKKFSERFEIPLSSLIFFSENIEAKVTDKLRKAAARKILALLTWIEEKDGGIARSKAR
ncbi:helix-turn-helix transcriptional regulator [Undibacterium sp.]|uniref:helix-turn-helix transcriptional regulator n=1 Tax=Undibacterium sp. TaxID=1914977 RepID=UPI00374D4625